MVADANTSLVMHFDVDPIIDDTGKAITNNGAVAVVTDAAAIGGFAASFSGSNYLSTPQVASLTFGANPFTIEFYLTTSVTSAAQWLITGFVGDGRNDFYLKLNPAGKLEWSSGMNNYMAMTGASAMNTGGLESTLQSASMRTRSCICPSMVRWTFRQH